MELQMLLFIFFHEVLKKKRKALRQVGALQNKEHEGSQRPDAWLVCPQPGQLSGAGGTALRAASVSAPCLRGLLRGDAHWHPVLVSLAQAHTVSSSGWGRCWEQRGLGRRGLSPALPFPSQAGPARQSAVSWGLPGPVPPPAVCFLTVAPVPRADGAPQGGRKVRAQACPPNRYGSTLKDDNPNLSLLDLILISAAPVCSNRLSSQRVN